MYVCGNWRHIIIHFDSKPIPVNNGIIGKASLQEQNDANFSSVMVQISAYVSLSAAAANNAPTDIMLAPMSSKVLTSPSSGAWMTMMVEPRMESTQPTLPCRLSFSFRTWEERRALWGGEGRGGEGRGGEWEGGGVGGVCA